MKKRWEEPKILIQQFMANEYVATCYSLYCEVSGDGNAFTGNTWHDLQKNHPGQSCDNTTSWNGLTTSLDGLLHGAPCANGSSLNKTTGVIYEYHKESAVGDIELGTTVPGTTNKQYAVWTSKDVNGTGIYHHYGYAVADSRPNHS